MPDDTSRRRLTRVDWTIAVFALALWAAEMLVLGAEFVSIFSSSLRSAGLDGADAGLPLVVGVVSAPAFRWLVAVVPPLLLGAALIPPALPLRSRRRTIRVAGGVIVAIAVLLLLGCVIPLLDVPMNVKT